MSLFKRYIKPTSLSWWGGIGLLLLGIVESIQTKTISEKIPAGLAAIGLRGAIN